jgi:hypothetical protein
MCQEAKRWKFQITIVFLSFFLSFFLTSRRTNNIWQAEYPSTYLAQFDTNFLFFSEMLKFSKNKISKSKNIVKDNSEYLGIFHLLK